MIGRALAFIAGVLVGGVLVFFFVVVKQPQPASSAANIPAVAVPAPPSAPLDRQAPVAPPAPAAVPTPAPPTNAAPVSNTADLILSMPVTGVKPSELTDTYNQTRGSRAHEALDIMAPRGREIVAVDDGRIVKLFNSEQGGLTLYQFNPAERFAYYYAHLDRYADGIKEGKMLKRGELVGYVGSTGNADPVAPHLHFAIFELGPEKRWWEGRPVNPYPLLTQRPNSG